MTEGVLLPWQAEWAAKVVVDTLDFKVARMVVKDRPLQVRMWSNFSVQHQGEMLLCR
jgi:hypothetical protein